MYIPVSALAHQSKCRSSLLDLNIFVSLKTGAFCAVMQMSDIMKAFQIIYWVVFFSAGYQFDLQLRCDFLLFLLHFTYF